MFAAVGLVSEQVWFYHENTRSQERYLNDPDDYVLDPEVKA